LPHRTQSRGPKAGGGAESTGGAALHRCDECRR